MKVCVDDGTYNTTTNIRITQQYRRVLLEFAVECCQVCVVRVAHQPPLDVTLSLNRLIQGHVRLSTPGDTRHTHRDNAQARVCVGTYAFRTCKQALCRSQ